MGLNQIGFPGGAGSGQFRPRINLQQSSGGAAQQIVRMDAVQPVPLLPGQVFIIPAGQWTINIGRYTNLQIYDSTTYRWKNVTSQSSSFEMISSDGTNYRLANTTGTPIGAIITNIGNSNATNGYNTVTVTVSAGNSTWGTLVGGSVNTTVTVTTAGNYALPPVIVWTPASNQTYPYVPPTFTATMSGNTISSVTVVNCGAGLTGAGTLTPVNQTGDTNPGGGVLTLNATLTNSGNLTAMWPLTPGTGLTSVPTFTFSIGGNMAATAIMDFTVTSYTVTACGFNIGASKPVTIISANGIISSVSQCTALTGSDYVTTYAMPRMAWIQTQSDANSNLSNNGNMTVVDGGKNLQAIPALTVIPNNSNATNYAVNLPAVSAVVGGVTDTSYLNSF